MVFVMYAGDFREAIANGEEFILEVASQREELFPELNRLNASFWDSPLVDYEQAGRIVHELIGMLASHGQNDANLTRIIVRLLPFFSSAYCDERTIRCDSD